MFVCAERAMSTELCYGNQEVKYKARVSQIAMQFLLYNCNQMHIKQYILI